MFDRLYSFKGKHADYVDRLTAIIDTTTKQKLFARNLDVYIFAPIVGFIFGNKKGYDNSSDNTTKIFTDQLLEEKPVLMFNYRLIMLLDQRDKLPIEKRLDRAFRYDKDDEKRKEGDVIYEQYVLGGVEVLYEKILSGENETDEILMNIYNFINEYNDRYNKEISVESINELCKSAKD